jgi:hypothetical protein
MDKAERVTFTRHSICDDELGKVVRYEKCGGSCDALRLVWIESALAVLVHVIEHLELKLAAYHPRHLQQTKHTRIVQEFDPCAEVA